MRASDAQSPASPGQVLQVPCGNCRLRGLRPFSLPEKQRRQAIFKKHCGQCHTFKVEGRGTVRGPNLLGVVGTVAGSKVKEWGGSHLRLQEFRVTWTEAVLLAWLERPANVVPQRAGDRSCMTFRGMDSEEDREDLVAYLAKGA